VIKYGGEELKNENVVYTVWREGNAPEGWKKSILVLMHKKGSIYSRIQKLSNCCQI